MILSIRLRMVEATTKLDPDAWLRAGLDALYEGGLAAVKIERLARRLGVTKGSFYWRFADQRALIEAMIAHWRDAQAAVLQAFADPATCPERRLEKLLAYIASKDARHDVAMRALARTDKTAAKALAEIDRERIKTVSAMFEEMGFSKNEARFRGHALYYYQIGAQVAFGLASAAERAEYFSRLGAVLKARGDAAL